jgi:excisionase family DNA binding protein
MDTKHLTVAEVAAKLNISPRTVRQWIADGKLAAKRHGKSWQIDAESVIMHLPEDDSASERHGSAVPCRMCEQKQSEIEHLRAELAEKNRQIESLTQSLDHAQQLLAIQAKTNAALTDRLQVIEDLRTRQPFWKRIFRV